MPRKAEDGFLFGCDPEFFIKDDKDNPVSAVGLIPGTKEEPHKVEGGAVQVDGMAAEINTDPTDNFEQFNGNIVSVMKQLKDMLPKGYGFIIEPSVRFSQEVFDNTPEHAKQLGCDPDYNAYTGEKNPVPEITDPLLRVAGGHLHFGWRTDAELDDEVHLGHCKDLAKQLDWFLAGWAVSIDTDTIRRTLYGKAGAFRPKVYGMEYRTLSNFWITSKDRRKAVWNRMQDALREMRRNNMPQIYPQPVQDSIVNYINTGQNKPTGLKYPLDTTLLDYAPHYRDRF